MRGIAAMVLALLCGVPVAALAEEPEATVALADIEAVPRAEQPKQPRLSLSARESLPGLAPRGSVDVGLQWRPPIAGRQIDITAWRRMAPQPDALSLIQQQQQDPVYGARVEMKLAPASKRMFADKFIGLQLDSGARIGIRKSNGNPTIYYRNQF